ncbi:hypothetical protein [Streptomyces sp. ME19-01-6]|uniref:hypothetical protein n=1 Tax=Streptomyces sp. ME19-01-6 TaxID=3028686 RepID=UPI0029A9130F|nr:hypothetical protein [Streptomyces sp. ME19-01-6]MDX3232890.1 hypothetical protein [Streptomyces sp. ME19-01-6]
MIEKRLVTNALATLLGAATSLPVGRSVMPGSGPPYYVLTPVDTSVSGAPYTDASEDMSLVYQVTAVSGPSASQPGSAGTLEQAEGMADKARTAILGRNAVTGQWLHLLTVTGAFCMCRELETEPGATSDPADGIISYVLRFRLDLTAA